MKLSENYIDIGQKEKKNKYFFCLGFGGYDGQAGSSDVLEWQRRTHHQDRVHEMEVQEQSGTCIIRQIDRSIDR